MLIQKTNIEILYVCVVESRSMLEGLFMLPNFIPIASRDERGSSKSCLHEYQFLNK